MPLFCHTDCLATWCSKKSAGRNGDLEVECLQGRQYLDSFVIGSGASGGPNRARRP